VDGVLKLGGNALLYGDSYDEAAAKAKEIMVKEGRTMIHPFDDVDVIAGQGTIGLEVTLVTPL
jgi:threonine dehydratase